MMARSASCSAKISTCWCCWGPEPAAALPAGAKEKVGRRADDTKNQGLRWPMVCGWGGAYVLTH